MWYKLTPEIIDGFHSGEQFNQKRFDNFIMVNGFTRYCQPGEQDYYRFLKTGRNTNGYRNMVIEYPPYTDHARAFKNTQNGIVCMVSQPYDYLHSIAKEVKLWAYKHGIAVDLYDKDKSWYYPDSTCLLIWHLPEVNILLDTEE